MYSFRHVLHCLTLITICYISVFLTSVFKDYVPGIWKWTPHSIPTHLAYISILTIFYFGVIGRMYFVIINFAGLIFYECFPGPVQLKADLSRLPRISFRIVTRGDYPDLIASNSSRIKSLCSQIGMKNFVIEIVTEKKIQIPDDNHLTQILVPESYETKRGTMFKARNLQYCLEDDVSRLSDQDWIVHLDEDSTLTTNALKGIANFVQEGKYKYGQGRISYDPDNITGTFTQLLTAQRIALDYGYWKVHSKTLNKIPASSKGSFVVCNVGVEKEISFDGGPNASILEFKYFLYNAYRNGYRIGWVEGEIIELGSLTVRAFVTQYSRVFKGLAELSKNDIFTGKWRLFYNMNQFKLSCHVFYLVSLAITLVLDLGYHSRSLLPLIGLKIAHDIYLGFFFLYRRNSILSWFKIIHFFLLNLVIGGFYYDFILLLCFVLSCFQKGLSFAVTKKTL